MHKVIRSGELQPSPGGTITFEGEPYASGVSFFLVNSEPGAGPDLHRHPYSETWIVRGGRALFTADGEELEQGAHKVLRERAPKTADAAAALALWMIPPRGAREPMFPAMPSMVTDKEHGAVVAER